jgi:hypothetical protein
MIAPRSIFSIRRVTFIILLLPSEIQFQRKNFAAVIRTRRGADNGIVKQRKKSGGTAPGVLRVFSYSLMQILRCRFGYSPAAAGTAAGQPKSFSW